MRILTTVALLLVALSLHAEELTFRGHSFTTTVDQFIAQEGSPDRHTTSDQMRMIGDTILVYEGFSVAGYNAQTQIEFVEDIIISGTYEIRLNHSRWTDQHINDFVDAYHDLSRRITSLYGDPIVTNDPQVSEAGYSPLIQDSLRDSMYTTQWSVGNDTIYMFLHYTSKWNLSISYVSAQGVQIIEEIRHAARTNTDGL